VALEQAYDLRADVKGPYLDVDPDSLQVLLIEAVPGSYGAKSKIREIGDVIQQ
jgi:hypothetical protein